MSIIANSIENLSISPSLCLWLYLCACVFVCGCAIVHVSVCGCTFDRCACIIPVCQLNNMPKRDGIAGAMKVASPLVYSSPRCQGVQFSLWLYEIKNTYGNKSWMASLFETGIRRNTKFIITLSYSLSMTFYNTQFIFFV